MVHPFKDDEYRHNTDDKKKTGKCKNCTCKKFKKYKRKRITEARPYEKGEDLSNISVADVDDPETDMGMIARNPSNHKDQWYVARKYFEENMELIEL